MKTRREFMQTALKAALVTTAASPLLSEAACATTASTQPLAAAPLSFSQITLPYAYAELEPAIDALTMEIHYTRHHAAYVKNANDAIAAEGISYASESDFFYPCINALRQSEEQRRWRLEP
ncbi:hypothetical protein QQ054_05625 [Oscillatoria amoena NRMC-F 0135]|nr:hypothetical protein [Oscillatoria amoena NRMC-F 0135]